MSGISQTIPNYVLGISEQPDQLKSQGQVRDLVNAIPDVSLMLVKRQGTELIEQLSPGSAGTNDANEHVGKWFDIYRDPEEQYMGVIRQNGTVQIWRLVDGPEFTYQGTDSRNYVNLVSDTQSDRAVGQGYDNPAKPDQAPYIAAYNNVATTPIAPATGTGLTVNYEVIDTNPNTAGDQGRIQSVKIHTLGTGYNSGDTFNVTTGSGTVVCEYYEGTAGEEVRVHYDSAFVKPYSIQEFSWPFDNARMPRDIVDHSDYLEHTDDNDIKTLTINDTTIIVNREQIPAMTTATEPAAEAEGFVILDQLAFQQVYTFIINQDGTETTIASAATTNNSTATTLLTDLQAKVRGVAGFHANIIGNGLHILSPTNGAIAVTNAATTHNSYTASTAFNNVQVTGNSGATFSVTTDANGNVAANSFTVVNPGTGIANGNTLTVLGTELGGATPGNDLTLTVSEVGGGVFSLSTPDRQLMSVFTDEVQDITVLPDQCHHHYRVKVANSGALEDDYYVRFEGSNEQDGQGVWQEWRGFGVLTTINAATMPHIMVRMTDGSFLVTPGDWEERVVGDNLTNPLPSFIGRPINNVALFRNRIAYVSSQNVILSRPGDFFNFFVATALTITAKDPIDISASAANPATLYDTIEVNAGLLLFSRNAQFMLTTDNDILSPETAKINFVSSYDYDIDLSPITLGTTIAFINDEAGNSRLYEMQNPPREGQPEVIEVSKIVSTRLPTGVRNIASSKTNSVVLLGLQNSAASTNQIWGYRYFNTGEKRIQNAWFRFTIPGEPIYQCIIRDTWYGCIRIDDADGGGDNIVSILKIDLVPNDTSINVPPIGNVPILVNLDNRVEIPTANLTYDPADDETTFDLPFEYAQTKVSGTDTQLMAFQVGNGTDQQCVDISTTGGNRVNVINAAFNEITLEGNWEQKTDLAITTDDATGLADGQFVSLPVINVTGTTGSGMKLSGKVVNGEITDIVVANSGTGYETDNVVSIKGAANSRITLTVTNLTVWIGYEYTMQVDFPTIYPNRGSGTQVKSDVQGSLIIHRCKFNTGATGTFNIDLGRVGRPTYSALHESRPMDAYKADNPPFLLVDETTIPCYERNYNINLSLKSKYPLPVTLISMTWEGEYTNKNYKRS